MELFSKQDPAVRESLDSRINQRWGQLYDLEKEWGEKALRYLLLTNSGGAIVTLSFLGGSPNKINLLGSKIALCFFVLGVFLVGVSIAKQVHHMSRLFKSWKNEVNNYYADNISWERLHSEDDKRAIEDIWDYLVPYLAFSCFIGGSISGGISLFL